MEWNEETATWVLVAADTKISDPAVYRAPTSEEIQDEIAQIRARNREPAIYVRNGERILTHCRPI